MKHLIPFLLTSLILTVNLHAQKSPRMLSSVFNDTILNVVSKRNVAPSFERSTRELNAFLKRATSNPKIINDTLFIYMKEFEDQISAGRGQAVFSKSLVNEARKKFPGNSTKALRSRLDYYIDKRTKN